MAEPGLAAVRKEYGQEWVQRILRWEEGMRRFCLVYDFDPETTAKELDLTRRALIRAKHDVQYALEAVAAAIRMNSPDWSLVDVETAVAELNAKDRLARERFESIRKAREKRPEPSGAGHPREAGS